MFAGLRRLLREFGGVSDAAVLGALADGPRSTYGIQRAIERREGRYVGYGTLLLTLDRMEGRGQVRSWWGEALPEGEGEPRPRMYAAESGH
jgi:DNA-binding PadR family transcriptional regulator